MSMILPKMKMRQFSTFLLFFYTSWGSAKSDTNLSDHWLWELMARYVEQRSISISEAQTVFATQQELASIEARQRPSITLSVNRNIEDNDQDIPLQEGPFHNGQLSMGLSYSVFNAPLYRQKILNQSRLTVAKRKKDRGLQHDVMQKLNKVIELAVSNEKFRIQHNYHEALIKSQALAGAAIKAGFGTSLALTELNQAYSRALREQNETRLKHQLLMNELASAFRTPWQQYQNMMLVDLSGAVRTSLIDQPCESDSLAVLLAEQRLAVAEQNFKVLEAEELPSIEIFTNISRQYNDTNLNDKYVNSVNAGIRFSWDLGVSFQNRSSKEAAIAQIYHAKDQIVDERRHAIDECLMAAQRFANAQTTHELVIEEIKSSLLFADYTRERFKLAGMQTVSIQQLLNAETALYEARKNGLQSRMDLILSRWELDSALKLIGVADATLFVVD